MERVDLQVRMEDLDNILREFKCSPSDLIPVLQAIQEKYGYIPKEFVKPVAECAQGLSESGSGGHDLLSPSSP